MELYFSYRDIFHTCCVFWPALGCLSSVYLHRLLGASVSYTDILSRYHSVTSKPPLQLTMELGGKFVMVLLGKKIMSQIFSIAHAWLCQGQGPFTIYKNLTKSCFDNQCKWWSYKCFHSKMVQCDPMADHRFWWLAKGAKVLTLKSKEKKFELGMVEIKR